MAKRQKMSRKASKKNFSKGNGIKSRNYADSPMRGGIRL